MNSDFDLTALHDMRLVGLRAAGDILRVTFAADEAAREELELTIEGVTHLVASPFLIGNIVSGADVRDRAEITRSNLGVSASLISDFFDQYGPDETSDRYVNSRFLTLSSSIGCEILAAYKGCCRLRGI